MIYNHYLASVHYIMGDHQCIVIDISPVGSYLRHALGEFRKGGLPSLSIGDPNKKIMKFKKKG